MIDVEKIETETALFFYEEDVLNIIFKDGADVSLEDARANLKARKEIQKEEKVKVFSDVSNVWQVSEQARKFFASSKVTDLNIAMALLTNSLTGKLLTNFFIKFNKPTTPTKMFNSKEKALAWLATFK